MIYGRFTTVLTTFLFTVLASTAAAQTPVVGNIASEFDVNQGQVNYRIPINLPAGRGGMRPELSLDFSNVGGNGPLGVGWGFGGLSAIQRCGSTIAQDGEVRGVNFDSHDNYCMNGQRLIPIDGQNGDVGTEYRTEIDGYSQIISVGGTANNPDHFIVKTKSGLVMTYGGNAGNASLAFPQGTLNWALRSINDTTGTNAANYTYFMHLKTQYLHHIHYSGGRVTVHYEHRPDQSTNYFKGNKIEQKLRVARVEVGKRIGSNQFSLLNNYTPSYGNAGIAHSSRIIRMKQCGANNECLPEAVFTWSNATTIAGFVSPAGGLIRSGNFGQVNGYERMAGDLNGDGISDLVWATSTSSGAYAYTALGLGDGRFGEAVGGLLRAGNFGATTSYSRQLGDFNGDGFLDLVWMASNTAGLYAYTALGQGNGRFDPAVGGLVRSGNFGQISSYDRIAGDLNGDGISDLIWATSTPNGAYAYTALGLGDGRFGSAVGGLLRAGNFGATTSYSRQLGDFNGDGVLDLIWMASNTTGLYAYTALGLGNGRFDPATGGLVRSGNFGQVNNYDRIAGDLNGDGITDLVWATSASGGMHAYTALGLGDGRFESAVGGLLRAGNFGATTTYSRRLGDFNGDGVMDLLWITSTPSGAYAYTALGQGDGRFKHPEGGLVRNGNFGQIGTYTPVTGNFDKDSATDLVWMASNSVGLYVYSGITNLDVLPHQLQSITDTNGSVTHISYKPLTDATVYTKGTGAQFPVRDLQYPQYVVSAVQTDNGIGGHKTVQYQYEGLKAHVHGRGSYGYKAIVETYTDTGKTKATVFNQSGFPYIGSVDAIIERYNGQLLNQGNNQYTHQESYPGVYSVQLAESVQSSYELDGSLITTVTTAHDNVDNYGNIGRLSVTTSGGNESFTKVTQSSYNNDTSHWYLGRLTESSVTHQSPDGPDQVRKTTFEYDSETGLLTTERIVGANSGEVLTTTTTTYDSYGQKIQTTISAAGEQDRTSTTTYDSYGQITQQCNVLGECETHTYTPEGWPATTTGPNGLTTSWQHDGFGRVIREDRADGTWTTTARHFANSGQCGGLVGSAYSCTITQSSGTQPAIMQYDRFDREVRKIVQTFDNRVAYTDTEFNDQAQVARTSRPYFPGDQIYWANSEYDVLDRVTFVDEPSVHGTRNAIYTTYNGLSSTVTTGDRQLQKTTVKNAIGQTTFIQEEEGTSIRYTYNADGNLLTTVVADDPNTTITLHYDEFGRKVAMDDPDMGYWTYQYNGFGELISQTDAKGQTISMEYDLLGRMLSRTELEGTSTWVYGDSSAPQGSVGKLLQESGNGLTKEYNYDNLGRPVAVTTTIDGIGSFTNQTEYDSLSRAKRTIYPGDQGFYTENIYNTNGFLSAVVGSRASAQAHDYSVLSPLVSEATTLADEYITQATTLKNLGDYYASQIAFYQSLTGNGTVNGTLASHLSQHQQQLSNTVAEGQALSPEFMVHLNYAIEELQAVTDLLNAQAQSYDAIAEQLVILAEQTLAAADHSFQVAHTLDHAAEIYTDLGSQQNSTAITYWRAADVDASGRISAEVYGNGIVNDYAYDYATGQLQSIHSSLLVVDAIRHLEYQYDAYQNVTLRHDLVNDIRETYDYDRLDRLTATHVTSDLYTNMADLNNTQSLNYNAFGDITYKSDVGHYSYGQNAGPHAVTTAGNKTYSYDANGNMISGDGRTIQYSSFNKPTQITKAGRSAAFSYGPDRARYKKVNHKGDTTLYVGSLYEQLTKANGATDKKHYIYAAGQLVAEHIVSSEQGVQTRYLHKDALGSIDLITDAYANVVDRRSFDSWGKLRNLPWKENASIEDPLYLTQLPFTNKGYTGHENVQEVDLIHMNGRLYDATLARFISADPHIQADGMSQSYNRYSYVMNNPMKYTDPSGYFFKKLFKKIKKFIGTIVAVVLGAILCAGFCTPLLAGLIGGISGAIGAAVNGGNILKGAISGAITGFASSYIGSPAFGPTGANQTFGVLARRAIAHGIVGGTVAVIQGGKFGAGFISSAFTKFVSGPIESFAGSISKATGIASEIVGAAGAALVGGTVSVINGGSFANGAQTAAIQYLFNQVGRKITKAEHLSKINATIRRSKVLTWKQKAKAIGNLGHRRLTKEILNDSFEHVLRDGSQHRSLFRPRGGAYNFGTKNGGLIPEGGSVSVFMSDRVANMDLTSQIHDPLVARLMDHYGFSFSEINVPTMLPSYRAAQDRIGLYKGHPDQWGHWGLGGE